MKAIIFTSELAAYLKAASKIIPKKAVLPILECVHIFMADSKISFRVTDLENELQYTTKMEGNAEGSVCVPVQQLLKFVSSYKNSLIVLEYNHGDKQMSFGGFKIATQNADDYPIKQGTLAFTGGKTIELNSSIFNQFEVAKTFLSKDELRPVMMGVLLRSKDGILTMVTTDAHRLFKEDIDEAKFDFELVVNNKASKLLKSIFQTLGDVGCGLTMEFSSNQVMFTQTNDASSIKFCTRLTEGKYPQYDNIIPNHSIQPSKDKTQATYITVDRFELLNEIKKCSAAAPCSKQMKFSFNNNECKIICEDIDMNSYMESSVKCRIASLFTEKGVDIGFNFLFLTELLNSITNNKVTIQISAPNRAILVRDNKRLFLQMPTILCN
jgi:DNA polymerase-3 subunit beta